MNKFFYPTFLLVLFLFFYGKYYFDENSQADRISNKLIARSASLLEKKHQLSVSSVGGGGDSKGLKLLSVGFHHRGKPYEKDEVRKLIIDLTQQFLTDINNDKDLKPYLFTFPFTPSNINVHVIFHDSDGRYIYDPFIDTVLASNGKIGFYTMGPEDEFRSKTESFEPYDDALAIVNNEKKE